MFDHFLKIKIVFARTPLSIPGRASLRKRHTRKDKCNLNHAYKHG